MEEEKLTFDNILGEEALETLFHEPEDTASEEAADDVTDKSDGEKEKKDNTAEVVDPDSLFDESEGGKQPESVGSGKDKVKEKEDAVPADNSNDASPNENLYSSIAKAMAVDGVFPNLEEDRFGKVETAEDFSELLDAEVDARLDDIQKRVAKALDNGVEPTDIRKYENTLSFIASITDAAIAEESEKGENLRRNLIYQDFLNKGYTPEKAQKFTDRTIEAGTDVEDAREALQSNREFFQQQYNKLLGDAQKKADEEKAERKKQADSLRNSIMNDKQLFGDLELSAEVRRKAVDSISKPVYRDPETGEYMTALQRYEMEHRGDFLKYAGLIFALTNGFKDFDSFTKGKVKKEVSKGLKELEKTLNGTRRDSNGNLRMVSNTHDDPESYLSKGFKLDI